MPSLLLPSPAKPSPPDVEQSETTWRVGAQTWPKHGFGSPPCHGPWQRSDDLTRGILRQRRYLAPVRILGREEHGAPPHHPTLQSNVIQSKVTCKTLTAKTARHVRVHSYTNSPPPKSINFRRNHKNNNDNTACRVVLNRFTKATRGRIVSPPH